MDAGEYSFRKMNGLGNDFVVLDSRASAKADAYPSPPLDARSNARRPEIPSSIF